MKNGVEHPEIIDLVSSDGDTVVLIIVQTEAPNDHFLSSLEDKINNYLSFAKDGQMYELYPDTNGKDITIRLDMYEALDQEILKFCEKAKEVLSHENVSFVCSKCEYEKHV